MRNRKAINLIARNGKAMFECLYVIDAAAKAVILAEYGKQVWSDVKQYAKAHPQIVPFINQDPHLAASISTNSNKERYARGGVSCQVSTGIVPTDTMQINAKFRMNEMTQYHPVYQQGYINENGNWTRFIVRNGANNDIIFGLNNATSTSVAFASSIIGKWLDTAQTQQGITINGEYYPAKDVTKKTDNKNPIWLFGRGNDYGMENIDIAYFETIDGGERHTFVPYQIGEQCYLLDLATCELTSGQFTIQITDKE